MRVTLEDVEKIARLARLELTEEEKALYRRQMEEMLNYVDQLKTLDTEGVEPTYFMATTESRLRDDHPSGSLPVEQALLNAPARSGGFFRVPKVLTKPGSDE
ncbi:Asp-tRNA(Asn)/Glu-tRNA(Gln) amidotransferase subunit GatC [bacterium]|nr:Asp-tRNA(Asn)/Glu-tRNA(Gln) amidotransferase subunit GatC [bacterium]